MSAPKVDQPQAQFRMFYRGYSTRSGRQAGQVKRLHILRPEPIGKPPNEHPAAFCYTYAFPCADSPPMWVDAAGGLPVSLSWCPTCLGHAADRLGWASAVAALVLSGANPGLSS